MPANIRPQTPEELRACFPDTPLEILAIWFPREFGKYAKKKAPPREPGIMDKLTKRAKQ